MRDSSFGRRLERLRRERGLGQARLAHLLADASGSYTITRHDISRYERGVRRPTWWLRYYAQVLGLPLTELQADHAAESIHAA